MSYPSNSTQTKGVSPANQIYIKIPHREKYIQLLLDTHRKKKSIITEGIEHKS